MQASAGLFAVLAYAPKSPPLNGGNDRRDGRWEGRDDLLRFVQGAATANKETSSLQKKGSPECDVQTKRDERKKENKRMTTKEDEKRKEEKSKSE